MIFGKKHARPDLADQRAALREPSKFMAVIKLPNGERVHASISNASATGALLELGSSVSLPASFVVQLSNTNERTARVVRTESNRVAIEYV